ncbi:MAG: class B sortase [Clostridiales bacterium]|nr:class B sortase [Clostridiales bacterium]
MKKRVLNILMVIFAVIFVVSGGFLIRNLTEYRRQETAFEELSSLFPETETLTAIIQAAQESQTENPTETGESEADVPLKDRISPEEWKAWWEAEAEGRFPVYQSLAGQNPDMVGWVRIEGTGMDYPVCQTPDDPEYYLHRNMNHENSSYGTPFLDANCTLEDPRSSLLIYGHHMRNGQMFAGLQNYTSVSYYEQHPYIQFDTLTEAGSYEIVMALRLDAGGTQVPWQQLLFPADESEFQAAWAIAEQKKFYETGVEVNADDELLALVTCEYTQANGRLMVIAKRIR